MESRNTGVIKCLVYLKNYLERLIESLKGEDNMKTYTESDIKRAKYIIWEMRSRPIFGHYLNERNRKIFILLKELEDILSNRGN